jgi:hypothetical protein
MPVAANGYQDDERGTGGLETQLRLEYFVSLFFFVLLIITTLTRLLVQEPQRQSCTTTTTGGQQTGQIKAPTTTMTHPTPNTTVMPRHHH